MKYLALVSLGAVTALAVSPAAAAPTNPDDGEVAQYGTQHNPDDFNIFPYGRFSYNFGPQVANSHLGPQKAVADKSTGMVYIVTFLPSGRSLFQAENGAEFIYDPRTKETIVKKTAD